jgi:glycosyltransferase involved in cell wall biosynthesis
MKEVVSRPRIYRFWKKIEQWCLPHFQHGYTVNKPLAREFYRRYRLSYEVIQNAATYSPSNQIDKERENTLLYQGAINEGRCFESLIPAMKTLPYKLIICGDGNFMPQLMELVKSNGVREKVDIRGKIDPDQLREITSKAKLGFTLFEHESANNYLSLANRFFDYIHAGTPQICVDFPAYREINEKHKVACLIPNTEPETISRVINEMMTDQVKWNQMHQNCISAAPLLSWQLEEKKLIAFYKNYLG